MMNPVLFRSKMDMGTYHREKGKGKDMLVWDSFIYKTVTKHPRNPKHVCGEEGKGRIGGEELEFGRKKKTKILLKF